ncbi:head maturation protease, ClpP-related [Furfurilactobacillus entadae]|uniref:head maturation protease, ClpP-related n=1 Tax=Furfurilactobacillus entadae TaxID=2922307 RepID=UPI0035EF0FFF
MDQEKKSKFWQMRQLNTTEANVYIDGEIVSQEWEDSDTSAAGFRNDLKQLEDVKKINLHINSPGGSVFEGIAIYNMLKQSPATINTYVDGVAASIASVIAMAGDTIFMPKNAMLMIHNPWNIVAGNATDLRKAADDLDQVAKASVVTYLEKAGDKLTEESLKQMLDDETWLTADEAVQNGLADEVIASNQVAACLTTENVTQFRHVPKQLIAEKKQGLTQTKRQAIADEAKQHQQTTTTILGGII